MKRLWAGALIAMLGWTAAHADGPQSQPVPRPAAAAPSLPAVTLGRPVSLGRPVPLPPVDTGVTQVSYQAPATLARPVVRGQNGDGSPTWVVAGEKSSAPTGSLFATAGSPGSELRTTGFADPPMGGFPTADTAPAPVTSNPVPSSAVPGTTPFSGPGSFAEEASCGCAVGDCSCGDESCCPDCCKRSGCCLWASAEYLLWGIRDQRYPALVTTNRPPLIGALNQPGTTILFGGGGQAVHENEFSGGRFFVGYWFDTCDPKGIEFGYFGLGSRSQHFGAGSNQFPVLARPFLSQNTGLETVELTAFPGVGLGRVDVTTTSRLWGAEANYRCNACCGCWYRIDFLAGVRYAQLTESLNINEQISVAGANPLGFPVGTAASVSDRFGTRNEFVGGQVGADMNFHYGCWSVDLLGKLALGNNHEVVNIQGSQIVTTPGGVPQVFNGGLLALPSNSGRFTRDRFSVMPELGVKLGYNITDNLRVTVGYTWVYWSSVVRPAYQIDRVLDMNQIPNFARGPAVVGASRPGVPFTQSDFWAQGVSFGLEYNY